MITIRDPTDADRIGDPSVRSLVRRRLAEVLDGEPYQPDIHGEFVVAEPGDTAAALEEGIGVPVASNPFDGSRFPDPAFAPVSEFIEDHGECYEMFYIFSDDGAGVAVFVPKSEAIDAELLALCARHAEPTVTP